MTGCCELLNVRTIVDEALDALGRFDIDGLERIGVGCENWLSERDSVGSEREVSVVGITGRGDIRLFARLLETTKANIGLVCQSRLMSTVQLEYVPGAGCQGCGALD
jgi:hypothetical protein